MAHVATLLDRLMLNSLVHRHGYNKGLLKLYRYESNGVVHKSAWAKISRPALTLEISPCNIGVPFGAIR